MFEDNLGEILGHREGGIHVAKTGGEDHVEARRRILTDDALSVGAFRHVFYVLGLDLAAEVLHGGQAAAILFIGPAHIARGADIDKGDLKRLLGLGRQWSGQGEGYGEYQYS